jgi:hypothetical protein
MCYHSCYQVGGFGALSGPFLPAFRESATPFQVLIVRAKRLNQQEMSGYARFCPYLGAETENPRVGGSILSLATFQAHREYRISNFPIFMFAFETNGA